MTTSIPNSASPPPPQEAVKIKIADIAISNDWQVRTQINDLTVSTYKTIYKNGGDLPPITVARVEGALRLVDGWHRIKALRLLGRAHVEATIIDLSMTEARWAAAKANLSHGLPLKAREVRNVFKAYVRSRQHLMKGGRIKSYRVMEEDLNHRISYRTLNTWMQKDHPKIAKQMRQQYGEDTKAHYHDGDAPLPDTTTISPLQAAIAGLDRVVAEARAMSAEDRGALLSHAKGTVTGIEGAGPWTMSEVNDDF